MPESGVSEAEGRRSVSERDETVYKLSEKYPRTTPEQVTRHRQFMQSECKTVAVGRGDRYFTATKRVISAATAGTGRAILDETTERLAYRMGRLTIYPFHRVMTRDGVLVKKPRSTFLGVAIYFARHAGIDLAKRQIIEGAWLGTTVSDKNLSTYVVQLREAIGHEGSIATLHNFGYKNVTPTDILSGKDAEPPRAFTAPRIVKLHRSDIPLVGREMELARLTDLVRPDWPTNSAGGSPPNISMA
jgi:DNA-binding winged helix-turn-helix (wHTH) protein